jgi:F0F1-type ATP synthase membrane subunit b/b'
VGGGRYRKILEEREDRIAEQALQGRDNIVNGHAHLRAERVGGGRYRKILEEREDRIAE